MKIELFDPKIFINVSFSIWSKLKNTHLLLIYIYKNVKIFFAFKNNYLYQEIFSEHEVLKIKKGFFLAYIKIENFNFLHFNILFGNFTTVLNKLKKKSEKKIM